MTFHTAAGTFSLVFEVKMSAFEQSAEERRILLEKAKRRAVLRAEFLKQTSNPFNHGEGGSLVCKFLIGKQKPMNPILSVMSSKY